MRDRFAVDRLSPVDRCAVDRAEPCSERMDM